MKYTSVDFDYEINAYSGQSNIIISVDAENKLNGSSYTNILEVYNLSQYLSVNSTCDTANSKLIIDSKAYNNITLRIVDEAVIDFNYSEVITFTLMMDKEYFAIQTANGKYYPINENVPLAEVKLNVHLYNSAKSIQVIGEDEEKTTHDDISFDVYLTTDFVDKTASDMVVEKLMVDSEGNICLLEDTLIQDSIIISLDVVGGEAEKNKHWVHETMRQYNIHSIKEIFLLSVTNNGTVTLVHQNETENQKKKEGRIHEHSESDAGGGKIPAGYERTPWLPVQRPENGGDRLLSRR